MKDANYAQESSRFEERDPLNDVPPIHRLPFEIFLQIIRMCVEMCSKPIHALVTLAQVCRRWSEVVDEPLLWRRIDAFEGLELIRMALEKAEGTPLDLVYKESTASLPLDDFCEAARGRLGQWNSLVIEARQVAGHCAPIEDSVPLRLRKLHLLEYPNWFDATTYMPLFGGHPAPPNLHDVSFTTIDPDLSKLCLTGLTSLELEDVYGPKEADFIQILRSSPALRVIRLVSSSFQSSGADVQSAPVQPIRLASLVSVTAVGIDFDSIRFILSSIDAPELHTLSMGCDMHNGQIPMVDLSTEGSQHLLSRLKSILSTAEKIEVSFMYSSRVRISIGGFRMSVGYRSGSTPKPIFDYFRESFEWLESRAGSSIGNLPVHLEFQDAYPKAEVLQWFTSSVSVNKLTLLATTVPSYRPAVDVFELLNSPDTSLPHLEVISLEVVWKDLERAPQCIREFVRKRREQPGGLEGRGSDVGPLREIRLSAYHEDPESCSEIDPVPQDEEFLRKVEMAAGGLEIYWEGKRWTSAGQGLERAGPS
ncbi:hypothetical protein FRB90_002489 [Tulasnella sp. 427]|nr:hypothetical protein FRB90_002489 [Tulasnella sp. 427]